MQQRTRPIWKWKFSEYFTKLKWKHRICVYLSCVDSWYAFLLCCGHWTLGQPWCNICIVPSTLSRLSNVIVKWNLIWSTLYANWSHIFTYSKAHRSRHIYACIVRTSDIKCRPNGMQIQLLPASLYVRPFTLESLCSFLTSTPALASITARNHNHNRHQPCASSTQWTNNSSVCYSTLIAMANTKGHEISQNTLCISIQWNERMKWFDKSHRHWMMMHMQSVDWMKHS